MNLPAEEGKVCVMEVGDGGGAVVNSIRRGKNGESSGLYLALRIRLIWLIRFGLYGYMINTVLILRLIRFNTKIRFGFGNNHLVSVWFRL